ncbi:MAG: hypothetical protein PUA95_07605, partial [Lactimicrobium massiliense]
LKNGAKPSISESEVQHFFYFSGVQYIVIQRQLCHLCKLLYKGTVGCQIDVFSICFYYIADAGTLDA